MLQEGGFTPQDSFVDRDRIPLASLYSGRNHLKAWIRLASGGLVLLFPGVSASCAESIHNVVKEGSMKYVPWSAKIVIAKLAEKVDFKS